MQPATQRLKIRTKLAYGVGQVPEAIVSRGFDLFIFFYYQQVLGLSGSLTGAAIAIGLAAEALVATAIGWISDECQSRLGRRHPFMYAAALPLAIFWYLLFSPPAGLEQTGLFVWLMSFAVLVRGVLAVHHVPHLALGAELTHDYEERTAVVAWRLGCALLGGIVLMTLGFLVFLPETSQYTNGALNPHGYPRLALFTAVTVGVSVLHSARGTSGHARRLSMTPSVIHGTRLASGLADFSFAWRNPSLRILLRAGVFASLGLGVVVTLQTHLCVFFWNLSTPEQSILSLPFAVGFLAGLCTAPRLQRRIDKKGTAMAALFAVSLLIPLPICLRLSNAFPENGGEALLPLLAVIAGANAFAFGLLAAASGSMAADVAQAIEADSGRAREGLVFSTQSCAAKLGLGAGHLLAGAGLQLSGFPAGAALAAVVSATASRNLGILSASGALWLLAALLLLRRYAISRDSHAHDLRSLGARHLEPSAVPLPVPVRH
jgi:glycoside/pentoside/hexuronide:cation symporter, GPH family